MVTFKQFFKKHYDEDENVAAPGGVFGDYAAGGWSASGTHTDYAVGDVRIPKVLGKISKKHRKSKKKHGKTTKFEYFTR